MELSLIMKCLMEDKLVIHRLLLILQTLVSQHLVTLEPGTEMIFTVKAYTKVGGGVAATISVFTFIRPVS